MRVRTGRIGGAGQATPTESPGRLTTGTGRLLELADEAIRPLEAAERDRLAKEIAKLNTSADFVTLDAALEHQEEHAGRRSS